MEIIVIFIIFLLGIFILNATSKKNYERKLIELGLGKRYSNNPIANIRISELRKKLYDYWGELVQIQLVANLENRELTKQEQYRYDNIIKEARLIKDQIKIYIIQ